MAVEPPVSDSLTDASTPRRTNCEEMEVKDALASENPLQADNVERAEQNMFYLCGFSLWFSYL